MEATFSPKLTQNQLTRVHVFHTTASTIDISIIYSQILRYERICSNDEHFLSDVAKLFKHLLARQYPFPDIPENFNKANNIGVLKRLSHTPKQYNKNICLITKFIPKIDHFIQSIKSNYHILKNDGKIGGVFVQPPAYAS